MPLFNKTFTLGKMNKDNDERVVPNGEYRDALNIEVQSSDKSDVGSAQNLMGNTMISNNLVPSGSTCVGSIADNKNDKIYYLVAGPKYDPEEELDVWKKTGAWKDYIIEYDIKTETFKYVFVDIYRANYKVLTDSVAGSTSQTCTMTLSTTADNPYTHLRYDMELDGYDSVGTPYDFNNIKGPVTLISEAVDSSIKLFSTHVDFSSVTVTSGSWLNFKNKRILNFDKDRYITGINIIDGMLFWTDNHSEPKKINIKRCIAGTGGATQLPTSLPGTFNGDNARFHTRLCVTPDKSTPLSVKRRNTTEPWFVKEENITVIRKGPLSPPLLKMSRHDDDRVDSDGNAVITFSSTDGSASDISGPPDPLNTPGNSFSYTAPNGFSYIKRVGDQIDFAYVENPVYWLPGDTIIFNQDQDENVSVEEFTEHDVRTTLISSPTTSNGGFSSTGPFSFRIESIDTDELDEEQKVWHLRLEEKEPMFEFKFPRFAYRYKYEDGEYSQFSPWSEPAFLPGPFDYLPTKAFNLGMTNRLRSLKITNYVVEESLRPQDVVEIDLLYKDEVSPNIYTVETIKMTDGWDKDDFLLWPDSIEGAVDDNGDILAVPSKNYRGEYRVTTELIHATVPSNQLLRQWDNVPRKALAQEITSNRLVYGNYLQNYNLTSDFSDVEIKPKLLVSLNVGEADLNANDWVLNPDTQEYELITNFDDEGEFEADGIPIPHKTVRSLREYQVGVVYGDEYGRETPVLAGDGGSGTINVPKLHSSTVNKLNVQIATDHPSWAKYFKFFVKETSNEYYNMAMDRWYPAEDGNIWLSFPSADRNKVDEESFIILKKRHDSHQPVEDLARYKIIAIENSAPKFIKTNVKSFGQAINNAANTQIGSSSGFGFPLPETTNQIHINASIQGLATMFANNTGTATSANSENVTTLGQKINEGTLFLRIRTATITSKWYQVTKMILDGDWEFTIDGVFGQDVAFASSDGTYNGRVDDLRFELANHKVEDKPEFEGRFFVKIYKDLVLLQNLLIPGERNWRIINSVPISYWNQPRGNRASEYTGFGGPLVDWESPAVSCAAEMDTDAWWDSPCSDVRNPGFAFNSSTWTTENCRAFFLSSRNQILQVDNDTGCPTRNNTERWSYQSHSRFHIDSMWVRATRAEDFTSCTRSRHGTDFDLLGRGIFNGDRSMDIGYIHRDGNYNFTTDEDGDFFTQIRTRGTLFRFQEDPDGIVYRVTGSTTTTSTDEDGFSNGHYGQFHTYSDTSSDGWGNNKTRFRVDFEMLDEPGVGLGNGPSGYHPTGGKDYTRIDGRQELGYWGGRQILSGTAIGGGGDDSTGGPDDKTALRSPAPPGYGPTVLAADFGTEITYPSTELDSSGNPITVTGIEQARRWRAHAARFHNIEIVQDLGEEEGEFSSENPAIWETEPKEDVGMDIYYEASHAIPVDINAATNELFAPIGSTVDTEVNSFPAGTKIKSWSDNTISLHNPDLEATSSWNGVTITQGSRVYFTHPNGFISSAIIDRIFGEPVVVSPVPQPNQYYLVLRGWTGPALETANARYNDFPHNQIYTLSWFNAYCFGNGIESDRIRDDFNQSMLANGVKASTVLAEQYKEDHRKTGLIHSGIYNSTSNVNRLNQFIAAEKITKDMNPSYGSIQKLHTRDTNIVVLHEDKCMKVLADKDALFNADGKQNVAISSNFLGSDQPFATKYGISTNPESCVSDLDGRLYFSDRTRGAIIRLSNDGITNISDYGMKNWFGDNLGPLTRQILGSYDDKKREYNITIKGLYPVSTSSEDNECGCINGASNVSLSKDPDDKRNFENTTILRDEDNIDIGSTEVNGKSFYESEVTLSFSERAKGWISFKSFVPESGVSINNEYYTFKDGEMYKHHSNENHNTFYEKYTPSSVTLLFNEQSTDVKSFSTLNYEGTQAKIKSNTSDNEYYNLNEKLGWYVSEIHTNLQSTNYLEFKSKEDKWFTYIQGDTTTLQNLDEREFSVQGIGGFKEMVVTGEEVPSTRCLTITPNIGCNRVYGCTDPTATNYDPTATNDDGSCTYPPPEEPCELSFNVPTYDEEHGFITFHIPDNWAEPFTITALNTTSSWSNCTPTATVIPMNPITNSFAPTLAGPLDVGTPYISIGDGFRIVVDCPGTYWLTITSGPANETTPFPSGEYCTWTGSFTEPDVTSVPDLNPPTGCTGSYDEDGSPGSVTAADATHSSWTYVHPPGQEAPMLMSHPDFNLMSHDNTNPPSDRKWVKVSNSPQIWKRMMSWSFNAQVGEIYPTRLLEAAENEGSCNGSWTQVAPGASVLNSITCGGQYLNGSSLGSFTGWVNKLNNLKDNNGDYLFTPQFVVGVDTWEDVKTRIQAWTTSETNYPTTDEWWNISIAECRID